VPWLGPVERVSEARLFSKIDRSFQNARMAASSAGKSSSDRTAVKTPRLLSVIGGPPV
jgi:hypothetical protein